MRRPAKREFSDFICKPYCVFFKEGQKQDMACGGALAVMELIENGLLSIDGISGFPNQDAPSDEGLLLLECICRSCPFVLDGCDFRLPQPPADAVPCGGFVLLSLLFNAGSITPHALRTIANE